MITKKFCFGFVNSYFPIYFVGFMANYIQVIRRSDACERMSDSESSPSLNARACVPGSGTSTLH